MVQLKVQITDCTSFFLFISIPYGSIKSVAGTVWKQEAEKISIPYGSIKRPNPKKYEPLLFIFQFLMVQLKVCFDGFIGSGSTNFNSLWFN